MRTVTEFLFHATLLVFIFCTAIRDSHTLDCHSSHQIIEAGHILPETGHLNASGVSVPKNHYEYYNATHFRTCSCAATSCVRKCCPLSQSYGFVINNDNTSSPECIGNNNTASIDIPVHDEKLYKFLHNEVEKNSKLYHGQPCEEMYPLDPTQNLQDAFQLLSNGELSLTNNDRARKDLDEYCIDTLLDPDGNVEATIVLLCSSEVNSVPLAIKIATLISIPFFLLTLAVYCYLPELRNTHGKCLMCHMASLAVGDIFLSAVNLSRKQPNAVFCSLAGPVIQFSFVSAFFWLNVMCFDIWQAFSNCRGATSSRQSERKKFIKYSVYSWGGAAIILILTLIIEWSPLEVVKPNFGTNSCFLAERSQKFYYFYGLIAVLLTINLCLFVATVYKIIQVSKRFSSVPLQGGDNPRSNENKGKFFLYMKLFLVMGIGWTLEVVSFAVEGPYYIWIVPDVFNALQGLFIFIIFVCKARTIRLLMAKWKKHPSADETTSLSLNVIKD